MKFTRYSDDIHRAVDGRYRYSVRRLDAGDWIMSVHDMAGTTPRRVALTEVDSYTAAVRAAHTHSRTGA